jgi:hypothetical protein
MIKITDQHNNGFKFFCDVCDREIQKGIGECLFTDSIGGEPVEVAFSHYECSDRYEKSVGYACGNMSLKDFLNDLIRTWEK